MDGKMQIYDKDGKRLYLTENERKSFFLASENAKTKQGRTACRFLYYTGCRPTELIKVQSDHIDPITQTVRIQTAKKRKKKDPKTGKEIVKIHWREIPLPASFLDELNLIHDIKTQKGKPVKLWGWTTRNVWWHVSNVMKTANISGEHASPKGLRHAFGIACVMKNVPLTTVQKWMGHSNIQTTAIYTTATGAEERELAGRLWD